MLRVNIWVMRGILFTAYPLLYYSWVVHIKDTWVTPFSSQIENDVIKAHSDILHPEVGRWINPKHLPRTHTEFKETLPNNIQHSDRLVEPIA